MMYACGKHPRAQLALLSAKVLSRLFACSMLLCSKLVVYVVVSLCVFTVLKGYADELWVVV